MKKILLVSPYHGGSHKAWAEGYRQYSGHEVRLLVLPAFYWKWRMHGGAVTLAKEFLTWDWQPDVVLATDMLDLTTFLALTRRRLGEMPAFLYMHENQLTYPLPQDGTTGPMRRQMGERDRHYAFINYASAMAADKVFFNSAYHRSSFLGALPNFLKHYPDNNEMESIEEIRAKSAILPVGIDFARLDGGKHERDESKPPLIIWNQRWEYDKNPTGFFDVLYEVKNAGISFRVAVCGESVGKPPKVFEEAKKRLADEIVHFGYANGEKYRDLLWEADIVVSTAHHEFFGIGVLEAIYCHTFPLLPKRLSYVELMPASLHDHVLYPNYNNLITKLKWGLGNINIVRRLGRENAGTTTPYSWRQIASKYDSYLEQQKM